MVPRRPFAWSAEITGPDPTPDDIESLREGIVKVLVEHGLTREFVEERGVWKERTDPETGAVSMVCAVWLE